jgi:hypothetical protein
MGVEEFVIVELLLLLARKQLKVLGRNQGTQSM